MMNDFLSQKFRFHSFWAMVFLVFVHGYNLQDTYLQPWSIVQEKMTFTAFFENLFANGLLRFRIPILFAISGYLYALHDYKPYRERAYKRLRTLGIPYLLWSAIALILTYLLEMIPAFRAGVQASWLAGIGENRLLIHQYYWYEVPLRIILAPIPFQLWFIRVLLVYSLAYPALRWLVQNYPRIWFPFTFFLWFINAFFYFFEGAGLLFFSLGIWLQKNNFDIQKAPKYLNPKWLLLFFGLASFIKTYLAFQGWGILGEVNRFILLFLYRSVELSGFIGVWYGCDFLVKWGNRQVWLRVIMPFSFMIYVFHVPILYYLMMMAQTAFIDWQYYRLFNYIAVSLSVILISIILGAILRATMPKVYSVLTGGRGF
jgi:fucose 4-O-acetylase-like acetyltransferase